MERLGISDLRSLPRDVQQPEEHWLTKYGTRNGPPSLFEEVIGMHIHTHGHGNIHDANHVTAMHYHMSIIAITSAMQASTHVRYRDPRLA
jgi:hypothetical protein